MSIVVSTLYGDFSDSLLLYPFSKPENKDQYSQNSNNHLYKMTNVESAQANSNVVVPV